MRQYQYFINLYIDNYCGIASRLLLCPVNDDHFIECKYWTKAAFKTEADRNKSTTCFLFFSPRLKATTIQQYFTFIHNIAAQIWI